MDKYLLQSDEVVLYEGQVELKDTSEKINCILTNLFLVFEIKEKGNEKLYRLRLEQLISAIVWLCIIVAIIISILGKVAVYVLYGDAYMQSVQPLKILIWAQLFSVVSTTSGVVCSVVTSEVVEIVSSICFSFLHYAKNR